MTQYYVNYGTDCSVVVGPFEDRAVATEYAKRQKGRVQEAREPFADKLRIAEEACKRTFYVTMRSGLIQVKVVRLATSSVEAVALVESDLGPNWRYVTVREV